jgi:threonylcarbamoyladenosine tRNA methylthiotransferase MtaB
MHSFPYSRRPGTPADKMPDQCQNAVKSRRAHEAQQVASEMHAAFLQSNIGNTLPVLFETEEDGLWTGHSDSYVLVSAPGENLRGTVRQVLITESRGEVLFGHLAD